MAVRGSLGLLSPSGDEAVGHDDGIVIIPDMKLRLPDGAKLYVNSIEIESTATGHAPIVHFEDGSSIRCRRGSGVQIVRMPLEEEQNDN